MIINSTLHFPKQTARAEHSSKFVLRNWNPRIGCSSDCLTTGGDITQTFLSTFHKIYERRIDSLRICLPPSLIWMVIIYASRLHEALEYRLVELYSRWYREEIIYRDNYSRVWNSLYRDLKRGSFESEWVFFFSFISECVFLCRCRSYQCSGNNGKFETHSSRWSGAYTAVTFNQSWKFINISRTTSIIKAPQTH